MVQSTEKLISLHKNLWIKNPSTELSAEASATWPLLTYQNAAVKIVAAANVAMQNTINPATSLDYKHTASFCTGTISSTMSSIHWKDRENIYCL